MPMTERREKDREEMRTRILDAARELFVKEGYDNVTLRRVAEAIDYSPTIIYRYFRDKQELVQCLCNEDFVKLLALFGEPGPEVDPADRVRQLGRGYAQFGLSYPNHYRFLFMTPAEPSDYEPVLSGEQAYGMLRSAVAAGIEQGRFRPENPDTVAQVFWSALHGAVALLVTYGHENFPVVPAAPDLVGQVIENSIRGMLAPSPAGVRAE